MQKIGLMLTSKTDKRTIFPIRRPARINTMENRRGLLPPFTKNQNPFDSVASPQVQIRIDLALQNTLPSECPVSPKSESLLCPPPSPPSWSSKARTKSILRTPSRKNSSGSGLELPNSRFWKAVSTVGLNNYTRDWL